MKLTVTMMTANRSGPLLACLESIAVGSLLPDEVIIVDNQSKDDTRQRLAEAEFPFSLVVLDGPGRAFSESRNLAVQSATGDLVWFTDDDCLLERHCLERIAKALEEVDCVGGAVLPADDLDPPRWWTPDQNWLVGLSPDSFWTDRAGAEVLPATANMGFHKRVWEADPFPVLGGNFAAGYHRRYALSREDADWWLRQIRRGRTYRIDRRALVWHAIPNNRFASANVKSRAEDDGIAHWRRQRPTWEIDAAADDVMHFPAKVLHDIWDHDMPPARAWHRHLSWTRRQLALLGAAVDDDEPISPQQRTGALLRAGSRMLANEAKQLARRIAVLAHHTCLETRPLPNPAQPPERLLVVSHDFLGDAVLELPMLSNLRRAFPGTRISLLCGDVTGGLFEGTNYSDELFVLPRGRLAAPRAFVKHLQHFQPDVVILTYLHGALPLPLYALSTTPVITWDRDNGMTQRLWTELSAHLVKKTWKKPEVSALLDLLGPLEIPALVERPRYTPPPAADERAARVMSRLGLEPGGFAMIHFERGNRPKSWSPRRWVDVAQRLKTTWGLRTLFVGGMEDRGAAERACQIVEGSTTLHGLLNPAELAALLSQARLCLGADSGPQHLAQAVGTPTIILFGPMDERRWGPLPPLPGEHPASLPFRVVRGKSLETPHDPLDPRTHHRFMDAITVDQVMEVAEDILRPIATCTPSLDAEL